MRGHGGGRWVRGREGRGGKGANWRRALTGGVGALNGTIGAEYAQVGTGIWGGEHERLIRRHVGGRWGREKGQGKGV